MALAPVVLFVYNRPWHTRQTLEALSRNTLADQSKLYIYADGPKEGASDEQLRQIKEVRQLIREKKWCKEVEVIERDKNFGLGHSIISGTTEIVDKYGKIIVLEDDLVSSVGFLKYMNDALDKYENEEKVISISGYSYPVRKTFPETFFIKSADCWGWGTWKRGWNLFEIDGKKLLKELKERNLLHLIDYDGAYPFSRMLEAQIEGKLNSWAILWLSSAIINQKLTLYPRKSLIRNIGYDKSGTNCKENEVKIYEKQKIAESITVSFIEVKELEFARKAFGIFFRSLHKDSVYNKIKRRIKNIIALVLPV